VAEAVVVAELQQPSDCALVQEPQGFSNKRGTISRHPR
jgi:hypothetical protein